MQEYNRTIWQFKTKSFQFTIMAIAMGRANMGIHDDLRQFSLTGQCNCQIKHGDSKTIRFSVHHQMSGMLYYLSIDYLRRSRAFYRFRSTFLDNVREKWCEIRDTIYDIPVYDKTQRVDLKKGTHRRI